MKELREKLLYQETLDLDDGNTRSILTDLIDRDTAMKVYERPLDDGTIQLECPNCHCEVRVEFIHPCCWRCGQKLDWRTK